MSTTTMDGRTIRTGTSTIQMGIQGILNIFDFEKVSASRLKLSLGLLLLAIGLSAIFNLLKTTPKKSDSEEPPLVKGSLWKLLTRGTQALDDYAVENMDNAHGIFTLSFWGYHVYVVTSPEVTQIVQARSKYTGLGWVSVLVMASVAGQPRKATKALFKNVDSGDIGNGSDFVHNYHKVSLRNLSLSNSLSAMEKDFVTGWKQFIESLKDSVAIQSRTLNVEDWLRMSVSVSMSRGVWGPQSPYCQNPVLWERLWTFNQSFNLLKYSCPRIFARKGAEARERVVDAFVDYEENGGFDSASQLARERLKVLQQSGLERRDIARMALSQSYEQADNTLSITFALLSFILRDAELLSRVREELEGNVVTYDINGQRSVEIEKIKSHCPLLLSALHEVLRYVSVGVTIRRIKRDYPLQVESDKTSFLLRKGKFIWASGFTIHNSENFYERADQFLADRFLGVKYPEIQMTSIFRGFGGGGNICLGRHLARTVVTSVVGTMLMEFDFEPFEGVALCVPNRKDIMLGHATPSPIGNTFAVVKLRDP